MTMAALTPTHVGPVSVLAEVDGSSPGSAVLSSELSVGSFGLLPANESNPWPAIIFGFFLGGIFKQANETESESSVDV